MRTYKKVIRPAHETIIVDKLKCDLCEKEVDGDEWGSSYYRIEDVVVEIRYKTGSNYPDGGMGKEYVVDMCPDCFVNKLIPWLQSQGSDIQSKEWDW